MIKMIFRAFPEGLGKWESKPEEYTQYTHCIVQCWPNISWDQAPPTPTTTSKVQLWIQFEEFGSNAEYEGLGSIHCGPNYAPMTLASMDPASSSHAVSYKLFILLLFPFRASTSLQPIVWYAKLLSHTQTCCHIVGTACTEIVAEDNPVPTNLGPTRRDWERPEWVILCFCSLSSDSSLSLNKVGKGKAMNNSEFPGLWECSPVRSSGTWVVEEFPAFQFLWTWLSDSPHQLVRPDLSHKLVRSDSPHQLVGPDQPHQLVEPDSPHQLVGPDAPHQLVRSDSPHQLVGPDAPHQLVRSDSPHQLVRPDLSHKLVASDSPHQPVRSNSPHQLVRPDSSHQLVRSDAPHQLVGPDAPHQLVRPDSPH